MRPASLQGIFGAALLVALLPTGLEQAEAQPAASAVAEAESRAAAKEAERRRRDEALREVERRLSEADEAATKLASEVETLRADSAALAAALVEAARKRQATEARVRALEANLDAIAGSESAIKASLESRRDVIAEVLAALQRLGRGAAPAILIQPDDILSALRSAILLGAVVPGLREEVETLAGDLAELVRLREIGNADRARLAKELELLDQEGERLDALVRVRREQIATAEASLRDERSRSAALGREATSLKDLVERLDDELGAARRETEAERRRAEAQASAVRERFAAAGTRDPVHLAPRVPFAGAKNSLAFPVSGSVIREFGAPDGQGGATRGIVISARPRGIVTAPADGWVSYAGPFRSFGRLLIINAGDGYYLLLAGMDQINVDTGQFVLAGEPVGQMGETSLLSAALSVVESSAPALYVEFRKDGGSVDPRPWWARSPSGRVRG